MLKCFIFLAVILTFQTITAQTTTNASYGAIQRNLPELGFNLNSITKPSWSNQSFIDSCKSLGIQIIRYPGGTESQYFDWQTGKIVPLSLWQTGVLNNYQYLTTTPHLPHTLDDLKQFTTYTGAKVMFVLNMVSSTLTKEMDMLRYASQIGIPVEYVELANELYFTDTDFTNAYPTPSAYAQDMHVWIDSIRANFSNVKIAVIGAPEDPLSPGGVASPTRITAWNDAVFSENLDVDAITFHYYPPLGNVASNPTALGVLSKPFEFWPRFKRYTTDSVVNNIDVWITEYNLNEIASNYNVASTWAHGLFTSSFLFLMLEEPKINKILNHQITGGPSFASISSYTSFGDTISNRLTCEGNAMKLIHNAMIGKTTARKINFSVNPNLTFNATSYPSLVAWEFSDVAGNKNVIAINLSNQTFNADLTQVFGSTTTIFKEDITTANIFQKNLTTTGLIFSTNSISPSGAFLGPYSISKISSSISVGLSENNIIAADFSIYPNPFSSRIYLNNSTGLENYQFHNSVGQIIWAGKNIEQLDFSNLQNGLYFLKVSTETGTQTHKLIKQ